MTANTPQSRKARGRKLQQYLRDQLISILGVHEEDVESRSMGAGGEDLILAKAARDLFSFSPECKNQQSLNIWSALKQAENNSNNHTPLLVFKRNNTKVYATLELSAFLEIIHELNTHRTNSQGISEEVHKTEAKDPVVRKVPRRKKV